MNIITDEIRLQQAYPGNKLSPVQRIESFNRYENWFEDRGLPVPNPEWVQECKQYWEKRKTT